MEVNNVGFEHKEYLKQLDLRTQTHSKTIVQQQKEIKRHEI